ncbi:MAG: tetratricopeptide repeat protein [Planctomycetes bacterium]|nr:tetratricopeptide repeat protein [Planctomycetota bacterium]
MLAALLALPVAVHADEPVTWAGHVAALLDRHCVLCHRPGQSAPFSLQEYADARAHARQIVEVTQSGFMPPWLPDPGLGYAHERRLTADELALLSRWAAADAPEGDPALRPAPPVFAAGWHLGEPDLVLTVDPPYLLPADGSDVFRNLVVPVPFPEARYVCAVELRPGNPKVVHHAVLFVDRNRHCRVTDAADPGVGFGGMDLGEAQSPDGHFVGWTPGRLPLERNEARAWELPAGADLLLQLHLLPSGKPEPVAPQIGLYFSKAPPTERPFLLRIGSKTMEIAAGEASYVVEDRYALPIDVAVLGVYPHAHYLARQMSSEAALPDGTVRRLLAIRDWDFNWQDEYRFAAPIELPAGSEVAMRYVYDNSAGNPRNPSRPPVRVTFGARSSDEMADLWIQVLPKDPAQRALLERDFLKRDYRQHLASLELAIREAPNSAAAHHDLGLALHLAGRAEEAAASLRRALELDPKMSAAHNNLGIVLMGMQRPDEALPHFEAAVACDPNNANAHNSLGLVLRDRGLLARALGSFQRAADLDPTHASALRGLGGTLARLGRFADAEAPLRRALALEPAFLDAEFDLALALEATRRAGEACTHYRKVLAQKKDPVAAEHLAWILACHPDPAKRAPDEALRWARNLASIATDESRARVTDLVAAAQAAAGRYPAAVASAEKALQLARDRQDAKLIAAIEQRLAAYRLNQSWSEARFAER